MALPCTIDDFTVWLSRAKRGERIAYYIGDLMHDRKALEPLDLKERRALVTLVRSVNKAIASDLIVVCQKRLGPSEWEYLAVRRRTPYFWTKSNYDKYKSPTRWN